ncbi:MAG: hypothetical protein CMJ59_14545 [Planctomycetaceae bacterium]|nr:hypothetical protein [Planctomycetaceae bacterium]
MATQHVIIGGGPAATNAMETIREFDNQAGITLISDEPAHSRMALPYWLAAQIPPEHTHTADAAFFDQLNVDARIGQRVTAVDPSGQTVALTDGSSLSFDKLLIATGSSALDLPVAGSELAGVQNLWSLDHTQRLLNATEGVEQPRVLMIGAGFIGFIMLNAMHKRGWQLSVVERESHVLPRMLDSEAAGIVQSWLTSRGIDLHCGAAVESIAEAADGSKTVTLSNGTTVSADVVIVAIGIKTNLDFLEGSGVETDQGILVNAQMQTNFPHIYAGGDVAQGPVLGSDQKEVHPIQPTAVDHGRVAGANMAGENVSYGGSLSMNILDCCGLQTASFGRWDDASDDVLTISNPADLVYRKLIWQEDRIVGALFTGRANDMGMLNDVGMVKGILQTQAQLGAWKQFLEENPFDIRRAYIAAGVPQKLVSTTLLGRSSRPRQYRFGGGSPTVKANPSHAVFVDTKSS